MAVPFLNGWIGVDLFFVLSGFLITHHILRRGGGRPLAKFGYYSSARALRIVPSYVAVLALVIAGTIPLYRGVTAMTDAPTLETRRLTSSTISTSLMRWMKRRSWSFGARPLVFVAVEVDVEAL